MAKRKPAITTMTVQVPYQRQIKEAEAQIIHLKHKIQILKTKRKLEHLENGGELCSTCNGLLIFKHGNTFSEHFWAQCEDCKQTSMKKMSDWPDNPEEWPKS